MTSDTIPARAVEADADRVQHLDPRTLLLGRNVRMDTPENKQLISSVRDRGVLQPIIAYLTEDGCARVRFGHRRGQWRWALDGHATSSSERTLDRYLTALADWGYDLSPIERYATGRPVDVDEVFNLPTAGPAAGATADDPELDGLAEGEQ